MRVLTKDRCKALQTEKARNLVQCSIHMKASEQSDRMINHFQRLGDHNRPSLKASVPMSLSAIILFGPPGFLFALKMTTHRKSEIIGGKAIRAIQLDLPWCQPVEQTFKSGLVTIPTFPVNQLACITAISFPDPEFVGFFLR